MSRRQDQRTKGFQQKDIFMKRLHLAAPVALAALLATAGIGQCHDVNHQGRAPEQADPSRIPVRIIDRPVLDQDGVKHAFGRDIVGDHIVVMNFIFTSCGTLCPLQSAVLADLQDRLAERLGREVALVSISVDPVADVPERLHEQAEKFQARAGWHFLTGAPKDIEAILTGLRAWVETPEDHPGFFMVGSAGQSEWTRLDGLPSPQELMQTIDAVSHVRAAHR